MIFFNKQSFFYAFLIVSFVRAPFALASDLPDIESYAPVDFITPEFKNRKRAKSSAEKDAMTKLYKEKKDHENNLESAEIIENLFKKRLLNSVNKVEMKLFERTFDYMKIYTPEKKKRTLARNSIERACDEIILEKQENQNSTIVEKNNIVASEMKSSSVVAQIASKCASVLSSPEVKGCAAIDLHHIMNPTCSYDEDKSLKSISGGHVLFNYYSENLIEEDEMVFVGQDNETVGVSVSGKISKTLRADITELSILDDLKHGVTVAKSPDDRRFKISKVGENRYCGSYQDPANPLLYLTQFPLLVVDDKIIDENNEIYLGAFAQLKQDGTADKRFKHQKQFNIPVDIFNDAMLMGKKFLSDENKIIFVELTEQLDNYFKDDLQKLGRTSFPAQIYGVSQKVSKILK
ncbi:hypothetical protein [Candidatus Chromulinivorax destructor]|uniref:Uncharacterized protein n=1 Tax=Candidatus Chromulinivorax destructor TaxID=2066483 RepID=A0A345ZB83_9BACT|nr:hypothetical protein [Candidatus Chromulinivorax destructor]AXK60550.1 hypothetical protein C0J27_02205 [Candidatus Chromulinivorax destructor]